MSARSDPNHIGGIPVMQPGTSARKCAGTEIKIDLSRSTRQALEIEGRLKLALQENLASACGVTAVLIQMTTVDAFPQKSIAQMLAAIFAVVTLVPPVGCYRL